MTTPITYIPDFIEQPDAVFDSLWNSLDWVRHDNVPRREYYCSKSGQPYTYGRGAGVRTYESQPWNDTILDIKNRLQTLSDCEFDICFMNGYENQREHLGWHADDSPEMDDDRPIAIISLGAEREIWFCRQNEMADADKIILQNGSLCLMHPGMQNTHFHRIPKAGFECGPRISLTFRGYTNN